MLKVGSWNFDTFKACKLPQKVESAFTELTSELTDATYVPLVYIGSQLVNGVNYCLIAEQTINLSSPCKRIVKMIINESSAGKYSIVNINSIGIKN